MKRILSTLLSLIFMLGVIALPAGAASANAESTLCNNVPKTIQVNGATFNGTYNSKSKKLTYKVNQSYYEDFTFGLYNVFAYIMDYQSSVTGINGEFQSTPDETTRFLSIVFNDMIRTGKIKTIKFDYGKWNGYPQGCSFDFTFKNNHVTSMAFNVEEGGSEVWNYSYDQKGNLKKITYLLDETSYHKINQKNNQITTIEYYENSQIKERITMHYGGYDCYFQGSYGFLEAKIEKDKDNNISSISETVTYDNGVSRSTPTVKFTYMKI